MIRLIRAKGFVVAAAVTSACFTAIAVLNGAFRPYENSVPAKRWKIDIQVKTKGRYTIRSGSGIYEGEFSGVFSWNGFLEDDAGDFLLIHAHSDVRDWIFRERLSGNPTPSFLTEEDIQERPSLIVSYILRNRENIDIRFSIREFDVPLHPAEESYVLPLPSSRGDSSMPPKAAYDAFIIDGSNRIHLRTRDLRAPPLEKAFSWTWQRRDWQPLQDRTVEFFSRHDAEVTVNLAPLR